jgi:glycosyltransferase involved in cell wall biosynthesis
MRVLYIAPMLSPASSWGRWLLELFREVRPQGIVPVLLVTPGQSKYLESEPEYAGLEAHAVYPQRYIRYFMSRRGFAALLEMGHWVRGLPDFGGIDLVHSVEAHPWAWYARAVARRYGTPYVFTIHGDYGWIAHRRVPDKWMYGAAVRDASAICPVSNAGAALITHWFPRVRPERVRVIHNGVDVVSFAPIVETRRRDRPTGHGLRVLTVARLTPVKGLETSLSAFVQMREAGIDGTYRIVGDGIGGSYHRSLIERVPERYREDISFVGPLSFTEVQSEYARADVFVLTSRAVGERVEGLPLVILEAAACGIPVIATRNGGMPEGVSDGYSGFLLEEGDVTGAEKALTALARDREYAASIGENALKWIQGFDNSRRAAAYLDVYKSVCSRPDIA